MHGWCRRLFVRKAAPFLTYNHLCLALCGSQVNCCRFLGIAGAVLGLLGDILHAWLVQVFLTNNHLAIAMEYAAGGNLYQLVARSGGLPEPDARWYFQQLIFAIDYCHKMVRPPPHHLTQSTNLWASLSPISVITTLEKALSQSPRRGA